MRTRPLPAASISYKAYRRESFFASLDGLRCLSICAVIWHHTGIALPGVNIAKHGYLGVDLFFAISGFLITTLLLRERDKRGSISLKDFYMRRTLRIFPLYYAVIALYAVVVWAVERDTPAGRQFFANLPYFLTYTTNWFVQLDGRVIFYFAWSLATEEQFYLVWPTVEKLLRGWRPVWLVVVLLIARELVAMSVASGDVPPDNLSVVVILSIYPPLLGGVVLAHVLHDPRAFVAVRPILGARWAAVVILAALAAGIELGFPRAIVWTLMALLVGAVVVRESNGLAPVLTWRPFARIGMVSYGMYLLHMLSYNAVKKALTAAALDYPWLFFPLTVTLAALVATISYRYYEAPFLRLKDRFTRVPTRQTVNALGSPT
ncbi:MAG: O-acetyltransferase OatA [Betaproteobacteria bacterium]|nr:O-acetyltransferase OatA [Betaproteobacteria bacterium]